MSPSEKSLVLSNAKTFFKDHIALPHRINTEKLIEPKEFKINPFLLPYLAKILSGDTSSLSQAKALVYPRVLSTSITTIFGNSMQYFCSEVLKGYGSTVSGIDLEFIDQIDNRKKYCQLKAGSNTINAPDVETIANKFKHIKNLANTNHVKGLQTSDLIVGVVYGCEDELSSSYVSIRDQYHYPVIVGQNFWHRLSGDANFYTELALAFAEVANEIDMASLIDKVILELSKKL